MAQSGDVPGPPALRRAPIYKDLVLFQLAVLFFLADQFSKFLVREFLELGDSFPEQGFFRITHTYNTGSAFGLFRDQNGPLILVSVIGITILMLIYRSQSRPGKVLRLSLALQLGGAVGNLLDRLRLGHVTDFLDVGSWPVFNLADSSIVIGLLMLAWLFLRPEQRRGEGQPSPAAPETGGQGVRSAAGPGKAGGNEPAEPLSEEDSG
jgi:signal peptidase II